MIKSTKQWNEEFSIAYRQSRADTACKYVHGYAISIHLEFEGTPDHRGWVVDFAGLRPLKGKLDDLFAHRLLVEEDDPHKDALLKLGELGIAQITIVERNGAESLANFIYDYVNDEFLPVYEPGRDLWCSKVTVIEKTGNSAIRKGNRISNSKISVINGLANEFKLSAMQYDQASFEERKQIANNLGDNLISLGNDLKKVDHRNDEFE